MKILDLIVNLFMLKGIRNGFDEAIWDVDYKFSCWDTLFYSNAYYVIEKIVYGFA